MMLALLLLLHSSSSSSSSSFSAGSSSLSSSSSSPILLISFAPSRPCFVPDRVRRPKPAPAADFTACVVSCFRTDACLFSTLPAATPFSVISRVTFFAASDASATLCFVDCRFNANGRTRDTDASGSAAEGACRLPATSNPLPLRRILYLSSSGEARAFTGRCSGGLASKSQTR